MMDFVIKSALLLSLGLGFIVSASSVDIKTGERGENVVREPSGIIFVPSVKILPPVAPAYREVQSSPWKTINFEGVHGSLENLNAQEDLKDSIDVFTDESSAENISVVGDNAICGRSTKDFVYHEESGECYQLFTKGPCGENQILYKKTEDTGFCDCEQMKIAPLVYHPGTGKCYYVYTQAYCSPGKWLSMDPKGRPRCERNTCEEGLLQEDLAQNIPPKIVPLHGRGRCVPLLQPSSACTESQLPMFKRNHIYPSCGELEIDTKSITPVHTIRCPPGSAYNLLRYCSPIIEFDFD